MVLSYMKIQEPSVQRRHERQCGAKPHDTTIPKTVCIGDKMADLSMLFFLAAGLRLEMRMKLALSFL